ncbi:MAG TPA: hypothetical protein VFQ44_23520 [Streptosporangiaceae bacterium]|nr:hypothetical protein [Streptosporangiaceae bacterium]
MATVAELAGTLLATLPPVEADGDDTRQARIAAGLLRVALDRNQALGRADEHTAVLSTRRRAGKVILLANDPALLDPAEAVERAQRDRDPHVVMRVKTTRCSPLRKFRMSVCRTCPTRQRLGQRAPATKGADRR